ncbi:Uncharacterised protein [uncultured archaeon]|nr:Uncharacterised protein [uncultured archaeon]
MEQRTIVTALLLCGILFLINPAESQALQVNSTDSSTVSVSISSVTNVNIDPNALSYSGCTPGADCVNTSESSKFFAMQIENIGSHNITHAWFNVSQPTARPFGTGLATSFDAGNFVVLQNESGDYTAPAGGSLDFLWVDALEYNETRNLVYLTDPDGVIPPRLDRYMIGRFHNASYEYYWMLQNGTGGLCNTSDTKLYIGITPHTKTLQGSIDFSVAGNRQLVTLTTDGGQGWAVGAIAGTGGANTRLGPYCVAANSACSKVRIYRWNMEAPGATNAACTQALYFVGATTDTQSRYTTAPFLPGTSRVVNIRIRVPFGVYEGSVTQGTLTVIVNDA